MILIGVNFKVVRVNIFLLGWGNVGRDKGGEIKEVGGGGESVFEVGRVGYDDRIVFLRKVKSIEVCVFRCEIVYLL